MYKFGHSNDVKLKKCWMVGNSCQTWKPGGQMVGFPLYFCPLSISQLPRKSEMNLFSISGFRTHTAPQRSMEAAIKVIEEE
jgi:hypothetical protein